MNVNCFQWEQIKKCKEIKIVGSVIFGTLRYNKGTIFIPITKKQSKQDHNVIVYGQKIIIR